MFVFLLTGDKAVIEENEEDRIMVVSAVVLLTGAEVVIRGNGVDRLVDVAEGVSERLIRSCRLYLGK